MHFLPTSDQLELQRGVRDLLASRFPLDKLPDGYDGAVWQSLVETGVFSLRTELELGLADAVLVFEELGRACVPGPLVATFLAAAHADGPVTFVDATDQPLLVPHLETSTDVLVLDADEARLCPSSSLSGPTVAEPVDPLTPLTEIAQAPAGEVFVTGDAVAVLRRDGALLTAALQVGIAA